MLYFRLLCDGNKRSYTYLPHAYEEFLADEEADVVVEGGLFNLVLSYPKIKINYSV
jgi:hypothetical protein